MINTNISYRAKTLPPGTVLRGEYIKCNFNLANLRGVRLVGTFTDCNFSNATLNYANILGATFVGCSLRSIDFKDGIVRGNTFNDCDFTLATMKRLMGITTNKVNINCRGVLLMDTDFSIKMMGAQGVYALCPKDIKDMVSHESNTLYTVGDAEKNTSYTGTPRSTWDQKAKSRATLVNAKSLPPALHYRSEPSMITQYQRDKCDDDIGWEEEEEDYCNYMLGTRYQPALVSKYKYGYKDNAILECSDIEEYSVCTMR